MIQGQNKQLIEELQKLDSGVTYNQTKKSQRSAFDFFEKIETNFLEKYLLYIITDELNDDYFQIPDPPDQQTSLFKVMHPFKPNHFFNHLLQTLQKNSKLDQILTQIYQNQYSLTYENINIDEQVYIYQKIKLSINKMKNLGLEIQNKLKKQILTGDTITIFVMFTGDINHDFSQDSILSQDSIQINNQNYNLRVQIYYISKVSLFMYFIKTNGLNVEYLDDKIIQLYEMKRVSIKRRAELLRKQQLQQDIIEKRRQQEENAIQIELMEKQKQQEGSSRNNSSLQTQAQSIKEDERSQNKDDTLSENQELINKQENLPPYYDCIFEITIALGITIGALLIMKQFINQ